MLYEHAFISRPVFKLFFVVFQSHQRLEQAVTSRAPGKFIIHLKWTTTLFINKEILFKTMTYILILVRVTHLVVNRCEPLTKVHIKLCFTCLDIKGLCLLPPVVTFKHFIVSVGLYKISLLNLQTTLKI